MSILIKNTRYFDENWVIHENNNILIENGKIKNIGDFKAFKCDEVIDGVDLLWLPGLVDAHCHLSQQFLRGRLLDERPLIYKRINVPFESSLTKSRIQLSTEFACCEMIKNGVTSFLDAGSRHADVVYETLKKIGIRAGISYQTTDSPSSPREIRTTISDAIERNSSLVNKIRKENSLIKYFNSITAPTACSDRLIIELFEQAKSLGIPYELHSNEYSSEVIDFIQDHGIRPIEFLSQNNLLSNNMLVSHAIYLNPAEINLIKKNDVKIVHCPFSNCGKGVPETPMLLNNKINISLGSDGSGHGGIDMFAEMRLFRSIMNVIYGNKYADYNIMPAKTILNLTTVNGVAKLLDNNISGIKIGSTADIIAVDCKNLNIYPSYNLLNSMVESTNGMCVKHTIINGKLVMKDRKLITLDEDNIRKEAVAFYKSMEKKY